MDGGLYPPPLSMPPGVLLDVAKANGITRILTTPLQASALENHRWGEQASPTCDRSVSVLTHGVSSCGAARSG